MCEYSQKNIRSSSLFCFKEAETNAREEKTLYLSFAAKKKELKSQLRAYVLPFPLPESIFFTSHIFEFCVGLLSPNIFILYLVYIFVKKKFVASKKHDAGCLD